MGTQGPGCGQGLHSWKLEPEAQALCTCAENVKKLETANTDTRRVGGGGRQQR